MVRVTNRKLLQAFNFAHEGAQKFSSGKGHSFVKMFNLYFNFAKGTPAVAVGAVGYLKACMKLLHDPMLFTGIELASNQRPGWWSSGRIYFLEWRVW